ncbi:MAG TPA: hypothetical protein VLF93_04750 [Candidatus Saccharimonadales bacterium]|nr:hypothetical protein [Candidatus Saccharimonadales bacterium]
MPRPEGEEEGPQWPSRRGWSPRRDGGQQAREAEASEDTAVSSNADLASKKDPEEAPRLTTSPGGRQVAWKADTGARGSAQVQARAPALPEAQGGSPPASGSGAPGAGRSASERGGASDAPRPPAPPLGAGVGRGRRVGNAQARDASRPAEPVAGVTEGLGNPVAGAAGWGSGGAAHGLVGEPGLPGANTQSASGEPLIRDDDLLGSGKAQQKGREQADPRPPAVFQPGPVGPTAGAPGHFAGARPVTDGMSLNPAAGLKGHFDEGVALPGSGEISLAGRPDTLASGGPSHFEGASIGGLATGGAGWGSPQTPEEARRARKREERKQKQAAQREQARASQSEAVARASETAANYPQVTAGTDFRTAAARQVTFQIPGEGVQSRAEQATSQEREEEAEALSTGEAATQAFAEEAARRVAEIARQIPDHPGVGKDRAQAPRLDVSRGEVIVDAGELTAPRGPAPALPGVRVRADGTTAAQVQVRGQGGEGQEGSSAKQAGSAQEQGAPEAQSAGAPPLPPRGRPSTAEGAEEPEGEPDARAISSEEIPRNRAVNLLSQLRDQIFRGDLAGGIYLSSMRRLSAQNGISSFHAYLIYKALESEGLISIIDGKIIVLVEAEREESSSVMGVVRRLYNQIQSGELHIGDKLPSLKELRKVDGLDHQEAQIVSFILESYGRTTSVESHGTFVGNKDDFDRSGLYSGDRVDPATLQLRQYLKSLEREEELSHIRATQVETSVNPKDQGETEAVQVETSIRKESRIEEEVPREVTTSDQELPIYPDSPLGIAVTYLISTGDTRGSRTIAKQIGISRGTVINARRLIEEERGNLDEILGEVQVDSVDLSQAPETLLKLTVQHLLSSRDRGSVRSIARGLGVSTGTVVDARTIIRNPARLAAFAQGDLTTREVLEGDFSGEISEEDS